MAKTVKEKVDVLASYNRLLSVLNSKQFQPVYLLEGEEGYYIDKLLDVFNNSILDADQKDFNLITLYGKDSEWTDVVNACSRLPMFADYTIVILREAVQLKNYELLIPYFKNPAKSTILVIDYRGKDTNSKDKWVQSIKDSEGVIFKSTKIDESAIPSWVQQYAGNHQIRIDQSLAETIAAYLGNDLQKITNEIEKIKINEPNLTHLSPELVEKYVGISREYNIFDLPKVIFDNDTVRLSRMLTYFVNNSKSAPLPPLIATFYVLADKIYRCYSVPNDFNNPESKSLYYQRVYAEKFSVQTIHKFIALLNDFALKAVGIGIGTKNDSELLKEMVARLTQTLYPSGN